MIIREFRPTLSGKQSYENPDTSRLSKVPSEVPPQGRDNCSSRVSKSASGRKRKGASYPGIAAVSTSEVVSLDRH